MKISILISMLLLFSHISFGQASFSADLLQEDAELLWEALHELHPGLTRHIDAESLRTAYEQLLNDFSYEKSPQEAFLLFSEFTAKIKCDHTYVNPFNQRNKIIPSLLENNVLLPFTFSIIDQKIVVKQPLNNALSKNDVITHINDISVSSIIDSLTHYIKADGNRRSKKIKDLEVHLNSEFEYFDYYFPMLFDFQNSLIVRCLNGEEEKIQLLTQAERQVVFSQVSKNDSKNIYDDLWSYRFEEDYAYLKLGTFVTWKQSFDWKDYLDEFFVAIEQQNLPNLIIDIRGNGGGYLDACDYLVEKLAKIEGETVFRKPHLSYRKVSDKIRPHVSTWSRWFYNNTLWTKKLNDIHRTVRFSANKPKKIKKNKNAYQGNTYLLINESNSSASFILAEVIKENTFATLVGTETAGTQKGITAGQMFFLNLPNTKIEIDIPLIGRYPMTNLPDQGVTPDVLVEQTLEAYISNRDEQLEKVLELIKTK